MLDLLLKSAAVQTEQIPHSGPIAGNVDVKRLKLQFRRESERKSRRKHWLPKSRNATSDYMKSLCSWTDRQTTAGQTDRQTTIEEGDTSWISRQQLDRQKPNNSWTDRYQLEMQTDRHIDGQTHREQVSKPGKVGWTPVQHTISVIHVHQPIGRSSVDVTDTYGVSGRIKYNNSYLVWLDDSSDKSKKNILLKKAQVSGFHHSL